MWAQLWMSFLVSPGDANFILTGAQRRIELYKGEECVNDMQSSCNTCGQRLLGAQSECRVVGFSRNNMK